MSIRKFIAPTARQALRDIRNEFGDDAMILSNRQVDAGVEIVALANGAIDLLAGQVSGSSIKNENWGSRIKDQGSRIEGQKPGASSFASAEMGFARDRHRALRSIFPSLPLIRHRRAASSARSS